MTLRVGVLVNPVAGLGGSVGLKGSDGHWREALDQGAVPHAQERAGRTVAAAHDVQWLTVPGALGVSGLACIDHPGKAFGDTVPADTEAAAVALRDAGIDLLCFAGGDGTAADVAHAVGSTVACLGIPAGVKITSPVFAHDPEEAAWLVSNLGSGFETVARDVTDLDEEHYRSGRLDVVLRGSLRVPLSPAVQGGKVATTQDTPLEPLVEQVLRDWDRAALHVVGAGSVGRAIKSQFWGTPTLLGVDVIDGDRIVATDLDASSLEALSPERDVHVWLSIIGGQGVLLGRGTQVLSPAFLGRVGWDHLHVVAPPEKMMGLRGLWVDTGDPDLDASAPKHLRVTTGWNETRLVRTLRGADANA